MTAQEISDRIVKKTKINVFENSRRKEVIHYRSLLIYLLREKMNLRWTSIALFFKANAKDITHATIMHSHHYYPVYKDENKDLDVLEKQFNFKPVDLDTLDKIHYLENKVENLKRKLNKYEQVN
jgi:chromosomal replication initiation ATPase DnaA|tara:strand:+ start:240 stop:611 length:372 start_codon:yes stop_codon:yes gene_type:complete